MKSRTAQWGTPPQRWRPGDPLVVHGYFLDMVNRENFEVGLPLADLQAELGLQRLQHRLAFGRLFARLWIAGWRRPGELDVVFARQTRRIDHRTRCTAVDGESAFKHLRQLFHGPGGGYKMSGAAGEETHRLASGNDRKAIPITLGRSAGFVGNFG